MSYRAFATKHDRCAKFTVLKYRILAKLGLLMIWRKSHNGTYICCPKYAWPAREELNWTKHISLKLNLHLIIMMVAVIPGKTRPIFRKQSHEQIRIMSWNINGLRDKLGDADVQKAINPCDIVVLLETMKSDKFQITTRVIAAGTLPEVCVTKSQNATQGVS